MPSLPDIVAPDTRAFITPEATDPLAHLTGIDAAATSIAPTLPTTPGLGETVIAALAPDPLTRSKSAVAGPAPQSAGLFATAGSITQLTMGAIAAPALIAPGEAASLAPISQAREALFRIPESRLYLTRPEANSPTLVETNPLFAYLSTNVQSSGPILDQLGIATLKRLGDGFYEQQLVAEQLRLLTGSAQTDGDAGANARYRALLEAGKAAAKRFNFTPGISLSAEQLAQLSETIVWMEPRLIDGQSVLVPVIYYLAGRRAQA